MKILFVIRGLQPGGAETQLVLLANGLASRGHDVSIAVCYPGGALESALDGVSLIGFDKKGRWDFSFLFRFIQYVRKVSPDVVHGYMGLGNILTAVCRPFVGPLLTVWGIRASNMDLDAYDFGSRVSFYAEKALSRFADCIIVNSYSGMEHAVSVGFPSDKLKVVPNGIDHGVYKGSSVRGEAFRKEIGVDVGTPVFGLIGRVDPMKGHDIFLQAASEFLATGKDAQFVCVGKVDTSYGRAMVSLSEKLAGLKGRVHWLGLRRDMASVYSGIDVLVSASRFGEGFSNVVGEAMACGTPCLVTDVGDSARIVGETGLVVKPEVPAFLAEGMGVMLDRVDRDETLGRRCRERIVEKFSPESLIAATERWVLKVSSEGRG